MASNDDLAPSSLALLPAPPPSPPPSSLPSQTHLTAFSSAPSRPIPIEVYNHILHFAFGRHLPPVPLENRLDEPPSLAPLLPLTLVSKGLRELVLPYLYYHITFRKEEDWIQLLDPEEGLLVGEGEEATRRRGWVKKLSFPRDGFPVASWTASKDQPAAVGRMFPVPSMRRLDLSGFGDLEEVCIGKWGQEVRVQREIEGVVEYEMEGGPCLAFGPSYPARWTKDMKEQSVRDDIKFWVGRKRSNHQTTSVVTLLSQSRPPLLHVSLRPLRNERPHPSVSETIAVTVHLHDLSYLATGLVVDAMDEFSEMFPSSRFNLDLVMDFLGMKSLYAAGLLKVAGWVKDEAGWWTYDG